MKIKDFDAISVQDIAEASTLNRATFYDHYADKSALLDDFVEDRFSGLIAARAVQFDGTCPSALRQVVEAVCDYLATIPVAGCRKQTAQHMERAIIRGVQRIILEGLRRRPSERGAPPVLASAAMSWAIYGAAKQWIAETEQVSSEAMVEAIVRLVAPMMGPFPATHTPAHS